MARLVDLLDEAAGDAEPSFAPSDVERRAGTRRQRRQARAAIAAITAVVLIAGSIAVIARRHHGTHISTFVGEPSSTPPSTAAKSNGIFSTPTATTLIFDDGY